ncbi:MAG: GNAT family N-acetyltransferase [Chloroflexi bacterium]|nr:GNAT family N-acetyltransferase [Chloroflexota bacterium]MDA1004487.1 GNAT family N-acetyltransferase [Chloroflexota bacterium]
MTVTVEGPLLGQSAVCEPILGALPQWFGVEASNAQYLRDIDVMPTFVARHGTDGGAVGFVTVKRHFAESAELLVLGVLPERHRSGTGRAMLERVEAWLRGRGVRYVQVKTLGPSHADEGYGRTRAFYRALGYDPLEELTELWGADDPALIMIKRLA